MFHVLTEEVYKSEKINTKYSRMEIRKIQVGLEILFINITKILIIFLISLCCGCFKETVIMTILFWALRNNTFGLHAKESVICTGISIFTHVLTPLFTRNIVINQWFINTIYILLILLILRYAPADTENHPLITPEHRKRLKKKSVLTSIILFIIMFTVSDNIKLLILNATLYTVIGILPITYKILNRRYKNYEQYEQNTGV